MPRAAILVLTNLPDRESARRVAHALLTGRLAACVSIGAPVESMYHWQGALENANELPLVVKTRPELYARVEEVVRAHHPYELPEILAVPVTDGLPAYLDWIDAETAAGDP